MYFKMYLFLAVPGSHCCLWAFSGCTPARAEATSVAASWKASRCATPALRAGSVAVVRGLRCFRACGPSGSRIEPVSPTSAGGAWNAGYQEVPDGILQDDQGKSSVSGLAVPRPALLIVSLCLKKDRFKMIKLELAYGFNRMPENK